MERDISEILQSARAIDNAAMRTTQGIHKDDLEFLLNGNPLKKFGSQGQQKSYIIALKLAQYEYLKSKSGRTPILLLDDIFEKIDENRSNELMKLVCSERFGQIFVSDTSVSRVKEHFQPYGVDCEFIEI